MNKMFLFSSFLISGIIGNFISFIFFGPWLFHLTPWMQDMMKRMMGVTYIPPLNPLSLVSFILSFSLLITGLVGLIYLALFPEIKNKNLNFTQNDKVYKVILSTLTFEERKVIEILLAHKGIYLQKYISKETGLSRLKTHRIIKRLADRGIVTVSPKGNTNEVKLAEWFKLN
ncbi:hypothetical protein HRbin06_01036 [archaeon HR06]|nr:hypothetical protein HRbin06_01036 [archaeon HR06]